MVSCPVTLLEPTVPLSPLVLDSPHSGRVYDSSFHFICPLHLLRQTEDCYVDELITGATSYGATVLLAEFPRSFIDVNRAENDIDPAVIADVWPEVLAPSERTLLGLGLVRRLCKSGVPVYQEPLPINEVKRRIDFYYRPYHACLKALLHQRLEQFGISYLINCHSMPDRVRRDRGVIKCPDFVLGDRHGTSCDNTFTQRASFLLREMGYQVALNDPYKGVEIVRRYGQPRHSQHALQLEINRRLYMDEKTLEKTSNFKLLQQDLTKFVRRLTEDVACGIVDVERLAAE